MLDFSEQGFENIMIKKEEGLVELRTNAKSKESALRWKDTYCEKFNYCFNVRQTYPVEKCEFHGRYFCLFGDNRHKGIKRNYTGCCVIMNIKVKRITKDTVKKDKLVKTHPCFVTIRGEHNHNTDSATDLRQLRVLPGTRETFVKYFETGMTPAQAIQHHQEKLNLNPESLANNSINPSGRSVYYYHHLWMKDSDGAVDGNGMFSAIRKSERNEASDSEDEALPSASHADSLTTNEDVDSSAAAIEDEDSSTTIKDLLVTLEEVHEKFGDSESPKALDLFVKKLKSIKSPSQFNSYLSSFGSSLIKIGGARGGNIPCQPSSVARGEAGLPLGAAPTKKGQKRKNTHVP